MNILLAALFVQRGGVYFGIEGVDPWDEERDCGGVDQSEHT